MQLFYDPASTTSRPITVFVLDEAIEIEHMAMNLFAHDNTAETYTALNPNQMVPLLVEGDFRLEESSAILKYLAERTGSAAYPAEFKARARVNAAMDWFNTQFARDMGAHLVYPQVLPADHLPPMDVAATTAYGRQRVARWLTILDSHMIGENAYVCGDRITLADYLGAAHVTLGELIGFDLSPWRNVARWVERMKARPGWDGANAGFNGWIASRRVSQAA